jgi:hypothetical protein
LIPSKPKCVYATFRVTGPDLDPVAITKLLDWTPTAELRKGDLQQVVDKPSDCGVWYLGTNADKSINMDHHLRLLIDLFTPKIAVLQALQEQGLNLSVSGYVLTCFENVESHISYPTLKALAQLPCRFWMDVYFNVDDDEDEDTEEDGEDPDNLN